jgi:salicylate hydroxylase
MAIESGFALAQVLSNWQSLDTASAFQFFQDFRKRRTDKITQTSYETGKIASADIPEELWSKTFSPDLVAERMRWVMEYDLLADLSSKLSAVDAMTDSKTSTAGAIPKLASLV